MTNPRDIIDLHSVMTSQRSNWDRLAQDAADFFCPEYSDIIVKRSDGLPLHDRIFESKGGEALQVWVAIHNFLLTPQGRKWHILSAREEGLSKNPVINAYLESKVTQMFTKRYHPSANFSANIDKFYFCDGLFGNAVLFIDSDDMINVRYKSIHPKEIYFLESHEGRVNHVHRIFTLTARQAVDKFGDSLPEKIKTEARNNSHSNTKHDFIHAVFRNDDYDPNSLDPLKKKFKSAYVCKTDNYLVKEGGYGTMPYIISRNMIAPGEVYARSPAMRVLPALKAANFMKKTIMRVGALAADPPLISMNLADVPPYSAMQGALNYGYLLDNGTPAIQPLNAGGRIDYGMELINDLREDIGKAFFMHVFQILVENPQMTATEVMQRTQEKAVLFSPVINPKQNDLGAMIEREIDLFNQMGMFNDAPPELMADDAIKIEYDTEMTRMMRADEGIGIMRTIETAMQMASVDPSVIQVFDLPETIRELSKINGMPSKLLKTKEDVESMMEQNNAMSQYQQMAQVANKAAPAIKAASETGLM